MTNNESYRIAFLTLGCKVNQSDTDALAGAFRDKGFTVVDFDDEADVYVVNTCTVTNLADRKSRQMLRRAIRKNPTALVVAAGCLAETSSKDLVQQIPEISVIIGTRGRLSLVDTVCEELEKRSLEKRPTVNLTQKPEGWVFEEFVAPSYSEHTRVTLKIQEGCQEFCSYCKIPYARGPVRSRSIESVDAELRRLADAGYREVVLAGVHLGHYGRDIDYRNTIADVIRHAANVDGIERVRLSSIDPTDVTDDVIALVSSHPKVCRHMHIPLQGGTDSILRSMKRKYTTSEYYTLLSRIRASCPKVAITTDVIVGFPGETDDEFSRSLGFISSMGFSRIHVFPYSPRSGTLAASMPMQVSPSVKEQRVKELLRLGELASLEYNSRMLGETYKILVENVSTAGTQDVATGMSDTYVRVSCKVPKQMYIVDGSFISVRITAYDSSGVSGDLLEDNQF